MTADANILLFGTPNSGKTFWFNALTGLNQRVGNYEGVTVDCAKGHFTVADQTITLIDLPGVRQLLRPADSLDEKIALSQLMQSNFQLLVNVIDATQLERQLVLSLQLAVYPCQKVILLTHCDCLKKPLDYELLSKRLGAPIIPAGRKSDPKAIATQLKIYLDQPIKHHAGQPPILPKKIRPLYRQLLELAKQTDPNKASWQAYIWLIGFATPPLAVAQICSDFVDQDDAMPLTVYLADALFQQVAKLLAGIKLEYQISRVHGWLDSILLHPWFGLPIFMLMMLGLFFCTVDLGGIVQNAVTIGLNHWIIELPAHWMANTNMPSIVQSLLTDGLGQGIVTVLTFVPVMGILFFLLACLENSGYMARAAFVTDRFFRYLGLPGHAFVPLIVGMGCNVPAIMSARSLPGIRERILTILMVPFMSCSARLTVFTLFVNAFFPTHRLLVISSLYLLGFIVALATAWFFRDSLADMAGDGSMLELPLYQWPDWRSLKIAVLVRLKQFLLRGGRIIIPLVLILGLLTQTNGPTTSTTQEPEIPVIGTISKAITPLFSPIGLTPQAWPATAGLLSGLLAKEVMIGTLQGLWHTQTPDDSDNDAQSTWLAMWIELKQGWHSLWSEQDTKEQDRPLILALQQHFTNSWSAYAYLVFVLLYLPCVSATAAIFKELSTVWGVVAMIWSFINAYGLSVLIYQFSQWSQNPNRSIMWIGSMLISWIFCGWSLRQLAYREANKQVLYVS